MPPQPPHALITGGSRGIGLSIAQLFAKKGYRCTLISRSEDALKFAVASLHPVSTSSFNSPPTTSERASQPTPLSAYKHGYIAGSISPPQDFWSKSPSSPFTTHLPPAHNHPASKIDVLVNCAGITQSTLFLRTETEEIDQIIQTNLTSMMHGTKFLMRQGYLRGPKRGDADKSEKTEVHSPVIVNVASLLGLRGGFGAVAYAASKAGVVGFTRALATEYASHRVRVNAIVPGYIQTDMTRELDVKSLEAQIPLGRLGTGEEVAAAALFLVENEYAHNCVVNLDGGLSAV